MDAAPDTRRQLGQLMVDEGFLTEEQLLDALAEHNRSGTPLGKVLVDLGFVSPGAVANALAEQHGGLLRTEYGTSAGLREMAGRAPIRTEAPQPSLPVPAAAPPKTPAAAPLGSGLRLAQPAAAEPTDAPQPSELPAPRVLEQPVPEQPAPEPELPPAAGNPRIEELESQLNAALNERNALAESFNELQARLSDAAQAHEAGVSAEVEERIGGLESQLQAAVASREELERAQQQAAERTAALEAELEQLHARDHEDASAQLQELAEHRDAAQTRANALENDLAQLREHLDSALQSVTAEKDSQVARAAALEAELEQLRGRDNEDTSAQLQELAEQRDAAESRAHMLENELAQLREQASGQNEGLAAHVSGLEAALGAVTSERDAAVARAVELEPQVESLRHQLREAALAPVEGSNADVSELRRQLGARERRLAESVGEIAKMNREHRALLQLVERQFQLEETTTAVPEPRGEAAHVLFVPSATGYTLVERDGIAPEAGDTVEVEGGRFVVRRHGPSPLPGPRRRCAYLERS